MKFLMTFALLLLSATYAHAFELTSPDLEGKDLIPNQFVFNGFGCKGENQSPALKWSKAPTGTKSFAIIVHDPDAPTGGGGWWHWLVYNIPASVTSLPTNAGALGSKALEGAGATQSKTDFGKPGWGGPCSPVGSKHRYNFTVYALSVEKIDLPADSMPALVGFMINGNTIAKATMTAYYSRNQ